MIKVTDTTFFLLKIAGNTAFIIKCSNFTIKETLYPDQKAGLLRRYIQKTMKVSLSYLGKVEAALYLGRFLFIFNWGGHIRLREEAKSIFNARSGSS